jgi:ribose-phosphate pyrophosphokinase
MDFGPRVFSGTSSQELTNKIVDYLGLEPGRVEIKRFSDGEVWVKYGENLRGRDVFIVQSTNPPAENLLELLMMIDTAKRASARRITAVSHISVMRGRIEKTNRVFRLRQNLLQTC